MVKVSQFIVKGDYLLFDGESSFRTPAVKSFMKKHEIYPLVITPSLLHQLLSPCDNSFNSIFKQYYYRYLASENCSTITEERKINLALKSYKKISSQSISSMFKKCGWVPHHDLRGSILNLMSEGTGPVKNNENHKSNLMSYLKWCIDNNLVSLCSSITRDILCSVGLLEWNGSS